MLACIAKLKNILIRIKNYIGNLFPTFKPVTLLKIATNKKTRNKIHKHQLYLSSFIQKTKDLWNWFLYKKACFFYMDPQKRQKIFIIIFSCTNLFGLLFLFSVFIDYLKTTKIFIEHQGSVLNTENISNSVDPISIEKTELHTPHYEKQEKDFVQYYWDKFLELDAKMQVLILVGSAIALYCVENGLCYGIAYLYDYVFCSNSTKDDSSSTSAPIADFQEDRRPTLQLQVANSDVLKFNENIKCYDASSDTQMSKVNANSLKESIVSSNSTTKNQLPETKLPWRSMFIEKHLIQKNTIDNTNIHGSDISNASALAENEIKEADTQAKDTNSADSTSIEREENSFTDREDLERKRSEALDQVKKDCNALIQSLGNAQQVENISLMTTSNMSEPAANTNSEVASSFELSENSSTVPLTATNSGKEEADSTETQNAVLQRFHLNIPSLERYNMKHLDYTFSGNRMQLIQELGLTPVKNCIRDLLFQAFIQDLESRNIDVDNLTGPDRAKMAKHLYQNFVAWLADEETINSIRRLASGLEQRHRNHQLSPSEDVLRFELSQYVTEHFLDDNLDTLLVEK